MPIFSYLAQTQQGSRRRGRLAAPSASGLEAALSAQGLLLVTCAERRPLFAPRPAGAGTRIETPVLAEFVSELGVAQGAGVPILTALDDIAVAREYPVALREIAASLAASVRSGTTIAEAMRGFPRAFPVWFTALVEVGERTGRLEKVCEELYAHLRWRDALKKLLVGAAIYPATVIVATAALFLLIIGYVLPRLLPFLLSLDVVLPAPTRALIALGKLAEGPAPAIAALALAGAVTALVLGFRGARTRPFFDRVLLALPITGPLITQINASRLAHALGLMLESGLELVAALQLCEGLMESRPLALLLAEARLSVLRGESLSAALSRSSSLPRLLLRALAVGEKTGNPPEALGRVAAYYDRELPGRVQRLVVSLYPVVVVCLGAMILFLGLGLLLPIYASAGSVGR